MLYLILKIIGTLGVGRQRVFEERQCPYCMEFVNPEALVCRVCRNPLVATAARPRRAEARAAKMRQRHHLKIDLPDIDLPDIKDLPIPRRRRGAAIPERVEVIPAVAAVIEVPPPDVEEQDGRAAAPASATMPAPPRASVDGSVDRAGRAGHGQTVAGVAEPRTDSSAGTAYQIPHDRQLALVRPGRQLVDEVVLGVLRQRPAQRRERSRVVRSAGSRRPGSAPLAGACGPLVVAQPDAPNASWNSSAAVCSSRAVCEFVTWSWPCSGASSSCGWVGVVTGAGIRVTVVDDQQSGLDARGVAPGSRCSRRSVRPALDQISARADGAGVVEHAAVHRERAPLWHRAAGQAAGRRDVRQPRG